MTLSTRACEWLAHPMAQALARFNLLPSLGLHPSRRPGWPEPDGGLPAAVHRHLSQALLRDHALDPVLTLDDPAMPLALLPPESFVQLALYCGLAMNAQNIRRAIARTEVARLQDQLGEEALAFARVRQGGGLAGLPPPSGWSASRAREHCETWGYALLAQAFSQSSPALAQRVALRLPQAAEPARVQLEQAGLSAESALALAREFLDVLEPSWLSSFPAPR